MGRTLHALPVPTGDAVLELLPLLRRALDGAGPVLLPVPADDAQRSPAATLLDGGAELRGDEDDDDDPTALVVTTSGSTGHPKGALLPVSALSESAHATRQRLSSLMARADTAGHSSFESPGDRWLLALPATHIAGLQVLFRAVAADVVPTVMDTAEPFTPARFCAAVDRMPTGTRFTSLVPTQLVRLLADPNGTQALTTFDAVLVGGAAAPAALLEQATAAGVSLVTTYGMTETCGGCVYSGVPLDGVTATLELDGLPAEADAPVSAAAGRIGNRGRRAGDEESPLGNRGRAAGDGNSPVGNGGGTADDGSSPVGNAAPTVAHQGAPLPDTGLPVTDGSPLADGRSTATRRFDGSAPPQSADRGRVTLAGPVIARGYLGMPGHPAFARRHGQRVFLTQDVGAWQNGRLQVIGRIDDVIVTGGVKVDPAVVEAALAAVRGVAEVLVTGVPNEEWGQLLVALVVPDGPRGPDLAALRDAAEAVLDRRAAPRQVVLVDQLPYRGIGKPDRAAARAIAAGALRISTFGPRDPAGRP